MLYEMEEREINLGKLMYFILLHWRAILVVTMAAGCLSGLVGFAIHYTSSGSSQGGTIQGDVFQTDLPDYKASAVYEVYQRRQAYLDKVEFRDNSVRMHLDASNVWKGKLSYLIQADSYDTEFIIEKLYMKLLQDVSLYTYLEEGIKHISPKAAMEVVYINTNSFGIMELDYSTGISFITVEVTYDSEEAVRLIIDHIERHIKDMKDIVTGIYGEHMLVELVRTYYNNYDEELVNYQIGVNNDIASSLGQLLSLQTQLSQEQRDFYFYLIEQEAKTNQDLGRNQSSYMSQDSDMSLSNSIVETESIENVSGKRSIVSSLRYALKYALPIALAGAFICIFILLFKYVMNKKLREDDSIGELYKIAELGSISSKQASKKWFGFIDAFLLRHRNKGMRILSAKEAISLTAMAIKIAAVKAGVTKIWAIGCALPQASLQIIDEIRKLLEKENIFLDIKNDLIYDTETMGQLKEAEAIVIMETANIVYYREVFRELELVRGQGITVLGGVLIK